MSPVGVTPLAATLDDLARVYLTNRDSLEALLIQVDVDINGVAVAAVPTPELATPAIALTMSARGDSFVSVATPFGTGAARTLAPYGGLLGDTLSAGADAVGSPALAQRLAPAGVQFGADGQAFRVVDASLSEPAPVDGPGADLPAGAAPAATASGTPATASGTPAPAPVAARAASHGKHSARVAEAGSQRGTSGHGALDSPIQHPVVPAVPELPPVPHAGLAAGPVYEAQAVPAAFDGTGGASVANPGIDAIAGGPGAQSAAGAAGVPWTGVAIGVGAGYDEGGTRRLPPWLHESEDVWGEEVVVTSPVIGEVDQPNPLRAPRLL